MSIDTSELDVARQAQPEQDGREPVGQELSRAELAARLDQAIERAHRALLATQHGDGYWMFALTANAQMNAEYIMFNRFMERSEPQLEQRLEPLSWRRGASHHHG
jgi:hypothetical protein